MPGLESALKRNPLEVALEFVKDGGEQERRQGAKRRVDLYCDNFEYLIKREIRRIFRAPEVHARLDPFIKMAAGHNLFKRVVDEISRPVYSTAPVRRLEPPGEQARFAELAAECRLNETMSLASHLTNACNAVGIMFRLTERHGLVADVLTPNMMTVVPDPDRPSKELALIYDIPVKVAGRREIAHVFWDDDVTFTFTKSGTVLSDPRPHGYTAKPFVVIHRKERWGEYWDSTTGGDLEAAQMSVSILTALVLKLHKSQGHKQIVLSGDIMGVPKDQTLDEENAIVLPDGSQIQTLDLVANATHYTDTINMITEKVAANYGISRDRLNQSSAGSADEAGLLERRADTIRVFSRAEQDVFGIMKMVSQAHPGGGISEDATLKVDFAEISDRQDKRALLDIWDKMRSMGLRNVLDDIKALNPEVVTDEDAEKELETNLQIQSKWVERIRSLNMSKDASSDEPGQSPEENGAMGPKVRDGKMSRDEAAKRSTGNLRDLAKRVLSASA